MLHTGAVDSGKRGRSIEAWDLAPFVVIERDEGPPRIETRVIPVDPDDYGEVAEVFARAGADGSLLEVIGLNHRESLRRSAHFLHWLFDRPDGLKVILAPIAKPRFDRLAAGREIRDGMITLPATAEEWEEECSACTGIDYWTRTRLEDLLVITDGIGDETSKTALVDAMQRAKADVVQKLFGISFMLESRATTLFVDPDLFVEVERVRSLSRSVAVLTKATASVRDSADGGSAPDVSLLEPLVELGRTDPDKISWLLAEHGDKWRSLAEVLGGDTDAFADWEGPAADARAFIASLHASERDWD